MRTAIIMAGRVLMSLGRSQVVVMTPWGNESKGATGPHSLHTSWKKWRKHFHVHITPTSSSEKSSPFALSWVKQECKFGSKIGGPNSARWKRSTKIILRLWSCLKVHLWVSELSSLILDLFRIRQDSRKQPCNCFVIAVNEAENIYIRNGSATTGEFLWRHVAMSGISSNCMYFFHTWAHTF